MVFIEQKQIGKKGIINSKVWMLPVAGFIGVYLLFIVVASLLPTFKHGIHNITAGLSDVPLVGALMADGGIVYIILAVALFAVAISAITAMNFRHK